MAIRIDNAADDVSRSASLPSNTSFTIMLDTQIVSDRGATVIQPLVIALDGGNTDGFALDWSIDTASSTMQLAATDGGAVSSFVNFASRPAANQPFTFYVKCSGTGAGLLEAGWRYPHTGWVTATATMAGTVAQVTTLYFGGVLATYFANKRIQNLKIWDRALSTPELWDESETDGVLLPSGLNLYCPLPHSGDLFDRSPRRRNLTRGGTLTTEPLLYDRKVRPLRRVVGSVSDITLEITGQSATGSPGSVTAAPSVALGGQAATGAQGAVGPSQSIAGATATAAAGTATPTLDKAITGGQVTSAATAPTPTISPALSGAAVTSSAGTATPSLSVTPTGQSATSAAGTAAPSLSVALSGAAITSAAGLVSAGNDTNQALTGASATFSAGTLTPVVTVALSGAAVSSAAGTCTASPSVPAVGQSASVSAGIAAPALSVATSGAAATVSPGSATASFGISVSGLQAASAIGSISPDVARVLAGAEIVLAAGTVAPFTQGQTSVALSGQAITASIGALGIATEGPGGGGFEPRSIDSVRARSANTSRAGSTNTKRPRA